MNNDHGAGLFSALYSNFLSLVLHRNILSSRLFMYLLCPRDVMRLSLVTPGKDEVVTADTCTYAIETKTGNREYFTGLASRR